MSRQVDLPTSEQIHEAVAAVAARTGRPPSALAVATHLGLTNATFWRHFPDHAATIAEQRRRQRANAGPTALDTLRAEAAQLRRTNQELAAQLATAVAQIQRLTMLNDRLRKGLEAATSVTHLFQR